MLQAAEMNVLRFVGADPGFANIGFCIVDLLADGTLCLIDTKLVVTKPDKKHYDDEQRRLILVEDAFREFIDGQNVEVCAIEAPGAGLMPGRKHAVTGKKAWAVNPTTVRQTSLVWGGIHGICRDRGIHCVKVELGDIKRVVAGKKGSSKADVIAAVKKRFPGYTGWPKSKKVEHVADAVGAVIVALNDPVVTIMQRKLATRV